MTDQEWLSCTDARQMLDLLLQQGKVSDRKLRLFAVAYCRSLGDKYEAVEVAERFADGLAKEDELRRAEEKAQEYVWIHGSKGYLGSLFSIQQKMDCDVVSENAEYAARSMIEYAHEPRGRYDDIVEHRPVPEPALLRDIFGNPCRPVVIDAAWLTWNDGTVPKLAQTIYEERRFSDLSILADALEESGCTNTDILSHCRQQEGHVRGCWVVDLLLGKK